jgi:signal transduction histidine kinase/CheY-like chemotaxis protein
MTASSIRLDAWQRALVLAPLGRDAQVADAMLRDAGLIAEICPTLGALLREVDSGAAMAVVAEEAVRSADLRGLIGWLEAQPSWSDLPFILLTERGGGLERNPSAVRLMSALGNVSFLERPFHPTTLISIARTALRGRRRQYEARGRMEALHASEAQARHAEAELRQLNETLEARVATRTGELEAANRQLQAQIAERQRMEATLGQMQRLEAIGQLTSGIAHDFNNLLTVVIGNIGFLEQALAGDGAGRSGKIAQRLSFMRIAAERGANLTAQLLAFSRRQRLEPKPTDLNDALSSMRDLLRSTLGGTVQIDTRLAPGLWPALVDPTQIELVVLNLAINGRDAMKVGGSLTIATANVTLGSSELPEDPPPGEYVAIEVADNGSGMSEAVRAKAFEPFFTTKEVGRGSGLGLSQVLGFAKQSGGGVRIETALGRGTSVRVYLPRAAESPSGADAGLARDGATKRCEGAVILLLDDDAAVRDVAASMLRDLGYRVLEVDSGAAALELIDHPVRIDAALLDFAMPGMNGAEVARLTAARRPGLPLLFMTGYADISALGGIAEERLVKKPFVTDELARKLRRVLARAQDADRFAPPAAPARSAPGDTARDR